MQLARNRRSNCVLESFQSAFDGARCFGQHGSSEMDRTRRNGESRWHLPRFGMFYFGGMLPGDRPGYGGNCLVDPACNVAASGGDPEGRTVPYWPSYQSVSPVARRTFLLWMAGGRNDPSIGIGYVFLFFYGLERRLLVDEAISEAPALIAEVRRLVSIYGTNGSFRSYATRFLDAAELISGIDLSCPELSPDLRSGYEMALPVRIHLGRKLASRQRLDSTDALLWLLALPDTYLRTPATRCFDQLVELWHLRFAVRYPEGLKVNPPKTRLNLQYRAASGGFERRIDISDSSGPLPDIAAVSAPLDALRDVLNDCTEELASYSRMLGRNPDAKGTMEAAFLLPKELLISSSAMAGGVIQKLEELFAGRNVEVVRVSQLATALSLRIEPKSRLAAGLCNQIGAFLDKLDIGFEPDRRYGSRNLEAESYVLLFKAAGGAPIDGEAPAYVAARAMVDVAALAAAADGRIEPDEYESIKTDIRAFPGVSGVERARLIAYASTLLRNVPAHQSAMQKLKGLDQKAKEAVVRSATSAVLADGHAGPDEVKFLERLYKSFGFPVEDVYSALHRGAVVIDEPVTVAPERRAAGIAIPPMENAPAPEAGIRIDQARLQRIRSETSAVSELLAGIFIEDIPSAPPPVEAADTSDVRSFPGLDAPHSDLLGSLLETGGLGRAEFEEMARKLRLLPDGAIETINDWGFDKFDEPLIADDDSIVILEHLREETEGGASSRMTSRATIRARERDTILQALAAGVVPRTGLRHVQVGRAAEIGALVRDIDRLSDGGAAIRFVIGEHGAGKTFFLNLVRLIALERRCVTIHADLAPDRRIHASAGQARGLYAEAVRNMATRTKPEGRALSSIVERFVTDCLNEAGQRAKPVETVIDERLVHLHEHIGGYDYATVLKAYWRGSEESDEVLKSSALRWLRGEYSTKTEARQALGVRNIIDDGDVYDALKLLAAFVKLAGYSGLLVVFDEM